MQGTMRTALWAAGLAMLLVLVAGRHAMTGGGGLGAGPYGGGAAAVPVISVESYGRTHDHLGRRIPQG